MTQTAKIEITKLTYKQKKYILDGFVSSRNRKENKPQRDATYQTQPELGVYLDGDFYTLQQIVDTFNASSHKGMLVYYIKQIMMH